MDYIEAMVFGKRLFAQGKWWVRIEYFRDGFYAVIDPDSLLPATILLVQQSSADVKYQEILFRRFS